MGIEIRVERMFKLNGESAIKAFADITINEAVLVRGLRVVDGKRGLFVTMPREKSKDNKWYDSVRCLTKELQEDITKAVLEAYHQHDAISVN